MLKACSLTRSLVIVSLILGVTPTSISAETVEKIPANTVIEETNKNTSEYYSYDGISYQSVRKGDLITIINLSTNKIEGRAIVGNAGPKHHYDNSVFQISQFSSDYDVFNSYVLYQTLSEVYIDPGTQATLGAIAGIIATAWGGEVAGFVADNCTTIAIDVYNNNLYNVYGRLYYSYNRYCTLLAKRKLQAYRNSSYTVTSGDAIYLRYTWESTPWDYVTAPAACRDLANGNYPYP